MKKITLLLFSLIILLSPLKLGATSETSEATEPTAVEAGEQAPDQPAPRVLTPEQIQAESSSSNQFLRLKEQKIAPDLQCILDRKRIDVAIFDGDVPPFFMKNAKGELTGLDAAIAKHLAEELGVKVSFVRVGSFNDVVQAVVDGKADVGISKLSVTLERAKQVQYTGRYVTMGKALLMNRLLLKKYQHGEEASLEDVFKQKGANIGVIRNSSFVQFAQRLFPEAEIVEYASWDEIVQDVLNDKLLAAFRDEWEIRKVMSDIPSAPIKTQAVIIKDEIDPIEMIVPWNSDQLARFIDKFIEINNYNFDVKSLTKMYKNYIKTNEFQPIN